MLTEEQVIAQMEPPVAVTFFFDVFYILICFQFLNYGDLQTHYDRIHCRDI